ncbi:MAG TPA: SDR family NAD(P)-dependent oxidoreductase [Dehalococcoidales bacterium]|nr:SDR family NAD(P)-dependent oxidoreductase [Dehalococcoidales bacterium]
MDFKLKGKVALVTGAASQVGFGKAICMVLAQEGCDIVAADLDLVGAQKTAADVEKLGRRALAVKCNITVKADCQAMAKAALDKFGRIDILVNNAGGIAAPPKPYEQQVEEDWDKNLSLNLKGPILVTQAIFQSMVAQKYGKIINVASDTAKMAFPGVNMYDIAKSGVYLFSRGLAKMLAPHNINVNVVSPGWSMETDFVKAPKDIKDQMTKSRFIPETPLAKGTSTMDIAAAVAYLASDLSGDITGQVLSISGGSTMQ